MGQLLENTHGVNYRLVRNFAERSRLNPPQDNVLSEQSILLEVFRDGLSLEGEDLKAIENASEIFANSRQSAPAFVYEQLIAAHTFAAVLRGNGIKSPLVPGGFETHWVGVRYSNRQMAFAVDLSPNQLYIPTYKGVLSLAARNEGELTYYLSQLYGGAWRSA